MKILQYLFQVYKYHDVKFLKISDETLSIFCEDLFIIRVRVKFCFKVGTV